jgi:very-short-patch-repair endonuclease
VKTSPEIHALFLAQHGVAAVRQLGDVGCHRVTVWRWMQRGDVDEILPGVVRLASVPETPLTRAMAVQLHGAPDTFLSAFTAMWLHGVTEVAGRRIHAMVPRRNLGFRSHSHQQSRLPSWVRRSQSNWHDEPDVVVVDGFRLERPEPMLFTIASLTDDRRFEHLAEKAWNRKLITPDGMREYVETYRRSGRSGVARTLWWLGKVGVRARPMQSDFEVDVVQAARLVGLPEPQKQFRVMLSYGPVHIDVAWPDVKLAVEPGHSEYHEGHAHSAARDAARDKELAELGWTTLRFNEEDRKDLAAVGRAIARKFRVLEQAS